MDLHVTYEMNLERICSSYSQAFFPFLFPTDIPVSKVPAKNHRTGTMRYNLSCMRNNRYLNNKKIRYICKYRIITSARGGSSTGAPGARSLFEFFNWFVFVIFDCVTRVYFNCSHQTGFTICTLFSIITTKHRVCVKKHQNKPSDPEGFTEPGPPPPPLF